MWIGCLLIVWIKSFVYVHFTVEIECPVEIFGKFYNCMSVVANLRLCSQPEQSQIEQLYMTDAFKNKNGNFNIQMLSISSISCSSEIHSNCYIC